MDSTVEDTVRYIDESNWTNLSDTNLDAYTKGKALKEKAAWDFVAENDSASHGFNAWSGVYGNGTLQKLIYSSGQVADSNHQGHATRLVAAHASAAVIFDADLP